MRRSIDCGRYFYHKADKDSRSRKALRPIRLYLYENAVRHGKTFLAVRD